MTQSEIQLQWLAAATARPHINVACTASRQMVEDHLDEHLLPGNLQNILAAVDALDAVGRLPRQTQVVAAAPKAQSVEPSEQPEETVPVPAPDFRRMTIKQLREYLRSNDSRPGARLIRARLEQE